MVAIVVLGSLSYVYLEGMDLFQALYLTITTITTVGFGDVIPHTIAGRAVTIVLMLTGIGVSLYFASNIVALVLEGHLANAFGRRKMLKRIRNLKDHIIICGAGRVGQQVIERLKREEVEIVVIEKEQQTVDRLLAEGLIAVLGDATEDSLLVGLGIDKARGLISALPEDTQNVYVTLTSKGLNPNLMVVARMDRMESESKLKRAGADKVISPAILGGRRMAISMLKPGTCEYVDTLIHDKDWEMEIEEIQVNPGSALVNKTLRESMIREETGVIILAIMRESKFISNPGPAEPILEGDLLIALGSSQQTAKLEQLTLGYCTRRVKVGS